MSTILVKSEESTLLPGGDLTTLSSQTVEKLQKLWDTIGIDQVERRAHLKDLHERVKAVFSQDLSRVEEDAASLRVAISKIEEEIAKLCVVLEKETPEVIDALSKELTYF